MNPLGASHKQGNGASSTASVSLRRFDVTDQRLLDSIDGADPLCSPGIMVRILILSIVLVLVAYF